MKKRTTSSQAPVSDESWVISAIGWTFLLGIASLFVGWKYSQHMQEKEDRLREGRAAAIYNDYLSAQNKEDPSSPAQAQTAQTAPGAPKASPSTLTMGQRLLSAPGFTAGPGFASEGVQQTGTVILDAIERAQAGAQ